MRKSPENWVNLGKILNGIRPNGWRKYYLSAHPKILSRQEADLSEMYFSEIVSEEKKENIAKGFNQFFKWFGKGYICLSANSEQPTVITSDFYEVLVSSKTNNGDLTPLIAGFLDETNLLQVLHFGRNCYVLFCYDMTVILITPNDLESPPDIRDLYLFTEED